jgi:unsaturated rhamnogalacturonyl hydrolase
MSNGEIDLGKSLETLQALSHGSWVLDACGVTRSESPIPALVNRDSFESTWDPTRVLLVGGLSGSAADVEAALQTLDFYIKTGDRLSETVTLSAIPCGNPDGLAQGTAPGNGAGGTPSAGYPPVDNYFGDGTDPETRYIWRWVSFLAPDLLFEVRAGDSVSWEASSEAPELASALGASPLTPADSLLAAMAVGKPNGVAPIPGVRLTAPTDALIPEVVRFWGALRSVKMGQSPARRELNRRRSRTPIEVARVLGSTYGHALGPINYIQGVAISGRLRLAKLDPSGEDPVADIKRVVEGPMATSDELVGGNGAASSGFVWADELAEATGDSRYSDVTVKIADAYKLGAKGEASSPADPRFRTEDMFFIGTMMGRAFALTGEQRYLDIQTRFLLDAKTQQDDGLFWHDRSTPYYWGRGNGFAALSFCETLTYLPDDHPDRGALIAMHVKQLEAVRKLQQLSGMYLQVMDLPGTFQELTATCMIGYAMARGMRRGWLDSSYMASVELAWQGVSERIDDEAGLVDPCDGTGTGENVRFYIDRSAVFGFNDRGGSMAIWFATELELLRRETA